MKTVKGNYKVFLQDENRLDPEKRLIPVLLLHSPSFFLGGKRKRDKK
jgi:hypothetical protein